jgi:hypothetical protein
MSSYVSENQFPMMRYAEKTTHFAKTLLELASSKLSNTSQKLEYRDGPCYPIDLAALIRSSSSSRVGLVNLARPIFLAMYST